MLSFLTVSHSSPAILSLIPSWLSSHNFSGIGVWLPSCEISWSILHCHQWHSLSLPSPWLTSQLSLLDTALSWFFFYLTNWLLLLYHLCGSFLFSLGTGRWSVESFSHHFFSLLTQSHGDLIKSRGFKCHLSSNNFNYIGPNQSFS